MHKKMRKILYYIGTEAEFIKLHPIIVESITMGLNVKLVCNGQNNLRGSTLLSESMSTRSIFLLKKPIWFPFKSFSLRALWLIFWATTTFFKTFRFLLIEKIKPERLPLFVIHGDTMSTLLGAVVAKVLGYKILHVESGLTSGKLFNPFPEEISRRIVTRISHVRFCPTIKTFNHVLDHPSKLKILTNGNTMWDMLQYGLNNTNNDIRSPYFLLVIHRQETLANPSLFFEIIDLVKKYQPSNLNCIFILHSPTKNFLISHDMLNELSNKQNWELVERLPFFEFVHVLKNASFALTDGGTNQEECFYIGIPCYLLRHTTERNEGLGENVVLKHDFVKHIPWFMQNYKKFKRGAVTYQDSPSKIIVKELAKQCEL